MYLIIVLSEIIDILKTTIFYPYFFVHCPPFLQLKNYNLNKSIFFFALFLAVAPTISVQGYLSRNSNPVRKTNE